MYLLEYKTALAAMLPYGLASNKAIELTIINNKAAQIVYTKSYSMQERKQVCDAYTGRIYQAVSQACNEGYIEKSRRKYGKEKNEAIVFLKLTNKGLNLLGNIWITRDGCETSDRKIKDLYDDPVIERHELLYDALHKEKDPNDFSEGSAKNLFLNSVKKEAYSLLKDADGKNKDILRWLKYSLNPMGLYPELVEKTSLSLAYMNSSTVYRKFRQANVTALFLANGFLTYLDRRPIDTNWKVDSIVTDKDLEEAIATEPLRLQTLCCYTLRHYYHNNPDIYSFMEPSMTREKWLETPAFYTAAELTVFGTEIDEDNQDKIPNSSKHIFHALTGVGIGKKKNYIVHHIRRYRMQWYAHVEKVTINAVQKSLLLMGTCDNPEDALITSAIMVVERTDQFDDFLFKLERERKVVKGKHMSLAAPYEAMHIVPMCASGAAELRALMVSSAAEYTEYLVNYITAANPEKIQPSKSALFRLTYDGIPVYIGHLMNVDEIIEIKNAYKAGMQFYISCYPQQADYYRRIMPKVEFI